MKIQRISAVNEPPVFLFQAACKAQRWWSQIALVTAWGRGSQAQAQGQPQDTFSGIRIFDLYKTKPAFIEEEEIQKYDRQGELDEYSPAVYKGWTPYTHFTLQGIWKPSADDVAKIEQEIKPVSPDASPDTAQWNRITTYAVACSRKIGVRMHPVSLVSRRVRLLDIQPQAQSQFHKSWNFSTTVEMAATWDASRNIERQPTLKALIRNMSRKRLLRGAEGIIGDLKIGGAASETGLSLTISGKLRTGAWGFVNDMTLKPWQGKEQPLVDDRQHATNCLNALIDRYLKTAVGGYKDYAGATFTWQVNVGQLTPSVPVTLQNSEMAIPESGQAQIPVPASQPRRSVLSWTKELSEAEPS